MFVHLSQNEAVVLSGLLSDTHHDNSAIQSLNQQISNNMKKQFIVHKAIDLKEHKRAYQQNFVSAIEDDF